MSQMLKKCCLFVLAILLSSCVFGCEENAPVFPCTVTFDVDGGQEVAEKTVKVIEKAPITSRKGYVFAGWYLDQILETPVAFPLTVTNDMTLYAKWIKAVYAVSFNTNGGSNIKEIETAELLDVPQPYKDGYAFQGWYKDHTLNSPVAFPLKVDRDIVLYAKWLKLEGNQKCQGHGIKFLDDSFNGAVSYSVTPNGFDLNTLATEGYYMKITATYDVRYVKDYDVLWNVGYLGSPKYEVSLMTSYGWGQHQTDLGTSTRGDTRTISIQVSAADLMNEKITLRFSTDNIQNIIYFDNIVVSYKCVR